MDEKRLAEIQALPFEEKLKLSPTEYTAAIQPDLDALQAAGQGYITHQPAWAGQAVITWRVVVNKRSKSLRIESQFPAKPWQP